MIYFDNGATTFPKPEAVITAVNTSLRKYGANPGRSGHKISMRASKAVYDCRVNTAKLFDFDKPENVIFTNNCTTALNTVIKGVLKSGDHAIISNLEHNSVLRPLEELKKSGVEYSVADFVIGDNDATVDNFRKRIKDNTKMIICTHASNVFGFRLPIERLSALCKIYGILFCVDCAQTAGAVPISLKESGIDYLCGAGHKGLYGPMGTGFLIINTPNIPDSLTQGGTGSESASFAQPTLLPDKFESGTPNLSGIAGLNEGVKFVMSKGIGRIEDYEIRLAQRLYDGLSRIDRVSLYAPRPEKERSVAVLSFNVKGLDSEAVASILNERYDIAVRAGLHCAPLAHKAMGTLETGTVRAVPSVFTSNKQIDYLLNCVKEITKKHKKGCN